MFIIAMIFVIIFAKSGSSITLNFLTDKPGGFPIGSEGGIFPAIIGSLCFTLLAICFASFFSLTVSIYLEFYCKIKNFERAIRTLIGVIGGIPSIVLGLFGYSFLVVFLGFGRSVLSGGLVLGFMIFPYLEIKFESIFHDINRAHRLQADSLGVNTIYFIIHIVIPLAWSRMLSAISLVSGTALGAAAPLMLTGAVFYAKVPKSVLSPAMALPFHLYNLVAESISAEKAFATAGVLIIMLVLLNVASWLIGYLGEER